MASKQLVAIDLGAESGRGIVGSFDGDRIALDVVHRFPNGGVRVLDALHWDVLRLYEEIKAACRLSGQKHGEIASLGIDTWGVDFALLGRGDTLLGNPRHYRDPHTENILDEAFRRVPRAEIFRHTGIQFMRFNSLFQLLALQRDRSPILEDAESFLMMPDLFHFWLTGRKANEFSNATTTQCYDPNAQTWAVPLLEKFGLPARLFQPILQPGVRLDLLRGSVCQETGLKPVPVILPATHDTGSAVAAVPAEGPSWCYLSSGTWSLMGVEISRPIIDERTERYNFTNEGGVGGTIRLLKNIMGLWLVQECRRVWERNGKTFSYEELARLAEQATPFVNLIDPDHSAFVLPSDMPAAIADFCRKTGQVAPAEPGAFVRCCLESLALRYRWVLERLEELVGRRIEVIHIVGGGSQNRLLNQLTADACNRVVRAGPVEATAIGNLLVQALGLGLVGSLAEARQVVGRSFLPALFEPQHPERWAEAWERFAKLRSAQQPGDE
jgi:rhamnulokinase